MILMHSVLCVPEEWKVPATLKIDQFMNLIFFFENSLPICKYKPSMPMTGMYREIIEINRNCCSNSHCPFIQCHASNMSFSCVHANHILTTICKDLVGTE